MANDLNQSNFIGRLGKDPEIRYTQSGQAAASFSIAVGSKWKDKNTGQQKENTEWVNLVAFGKLAEIMGEYLRKGSQIFVTAKFRTRKWQDQSGADRYTTEFVVENMQMLDSRQDNQHQGSQGNNNYQSNSQGYNNQQQSDYNNQRQQSAPRQGQQNSQRTQQGSYNNQQQGGPQNPMEPPIDFELDDIPFAPIGLQYPALLMCM